jgi:glutathione synthase/RimK-type ligase-like ATP-grasp enzyme
MLGLKERAVTMRHVWSVIEETETKTILCLNDADLLKQLLDQLENKKLLSREQISAMSTYISSRVPLIRDLAHSRMVCNL